LTIASGNRTIPKIRQSFPRGQKNYVCGSVNVIPMNKEEFKKFYREHLAVPVAGFGMAAVLLAIFLLLMTWLSGQVHLMQYSLDRFSH
jgi:hypothetical protein